MFFLALFLHCFTGVFCDVRDQYVPMDQAGQEQVVGNALQTVLHSDFSAYRPNHTVEEATGFNINKSSPR